MTDQQTMRALCTAKAEKMWAEFDDNTRACVRFGMFPAKPMLAAEAEGFDGRLLSVALMDQAKQNGGMCA